MTGDGQAKLIALLDDLEIEKRAAFVFRLSKVANAPREHRRGAEDVRHAFGHLRSRACRCEQRSPSLEASTLIFSLERAGDEGKPSFHTLMMPASSSRNSQRCLAACGNSIQDDRVRSTSRQADGRSAAAMYSLKVSPGTNG
jgi:hypothetical protein